MAQRTVRYENSDLSVSFRVNEDGSTESLTMKSPEGYSLDVSALGGVPLGELAEFAHKHGNLVVTTAEAKKRGRKPKTDEAEAGAPADPGNPVAPRW